LFSLVAQLAHGLCCVLSRKLYPGAKPRRPGGILLVASAGHEYPQRVVPRLIGSAGEGGHFCRDRTFGQSPSRIAVKIGSGQQR
jgi:hypothetical protein